MIEINIGCQGDDFVMNKTTMIIEKDHQCVCHKRLNSETLNDVPFISFIIWNKVKPYINEESEITINVFGAKFSVQIERLAILNILQISLN